MNTSVLTNDTPMAAKYRDTIRKPIFVGPGTRDIGNTVMLMVRRHPSFVFVIKSTEINPSRINPWGIEVHAHPERLPQDYDEDFVEAVADKLTEMREEFDFSIELMKVIKG